MKKLPLVIKIALIFLLIIAAVWLVLGVLIATGYHPSMPSDALIKWGMAGGSLAAGAALLLLAYLLGRRWKPAYFLALAALVVILVVSFLDQLGWADLVMIVVTLVPFVLLIIGRKWFLGKRE